MLIGRPLPYGEVVFFIFVAFSFFNSVIIWYSNGMFKYATEGERNEGISNSSL